MKKTSSISTKKECLNKFQTHVNFLQIWILFFPNSPPLFCLCYAGFVQFIPSPVLHLPASSYEHIIIYLDWKSGFQPTAHPEAGAYSYSLELRSVLTTGISHNSFHLCEHDRATNTQQLCLVPFLNYIKTRRAGLVWRPASVAHKAVRSYLLLWSVSDWIQRVHLVLYRTQGLTQPYRRYFSIQSF